MTKPPNLSKLVTSFFLTHLTAERNLSGNTTFAYRDALKLFLRFAAHFHKRSVDRLAIEDLTHDVVLRFLDDLEATRKNSIQTRNARLAALHCFYRYMLDLEPSLSTLCQRVLTIPLKRGARPALGYLSGEELKHILHQVQRSTGRGRRDYLLLALLYDSGARIQEILDMRPSDFCLKNPSFVRVLGKGRKERLCPLLSQTTRVVIQFLKAEGRDREDEEPFFQNRNGEKLTRQGARYILKKYIDRAASTMPSLKRRRISPHTLRHTKAMHLLQSGVPVITIKDVLGHADVKSTEIYVETDLHAKRKALEQSGTPSRTTRRSRGIAPDLLKWLESL